MEVGIVPREREIISGAFEVGSSLLPRELCITVGTLLLLLASTIMYGNIYHCTILFRYLLQEDMRTYATFERIYNNNNNNNYTKCFKHESIAVLHGFRQL